MLYTRSFLAIYFIYSADQFFLQNFSFGTSSHWFTFAFLACVFAVISKKILPKPIWAAFKTVIWIIGKIADPMSWGWVTGALSWSFMGVMCVYFSHPSKLCIANFTFKVAVTSSCLYGVTLGEKCLALPCILRLRPSAEMTAPCPLLSPGAEVLRLYAFPWFCKV